VAVAYPLGADVSSCEIGDVALCSSRHQTSGGGAGSRHGIAAAAHRHRWQRGSGSSNLGGARRQHIKYLLAAFHGRPKSPQRLIIAPASSAAAKTRRRQLFRLASAFVWQRCRRGRRRRMGVAERDRVASADPRAGARPRDGSAAALRLSASCDDKLRCVVPRRVGGREVMRACFHGG